MNGKIPTARLDKLLANLGYGSRKDIQLLARHGEIELDGAPLKKSDIKVALDADLPDRLTISDEALDPLPGLAVMLHKPLGATCSRKEAGDLVIDLMPPRWRLRKPALSTIGRLDKETSGLLLLTDDGQFLHRVIAPSSNLGKRYLAKLDRPLSSDVVELFAAGTLMLEEEEKPLLPAKLELINETEAYLTITEGRYHQVRRMFAAVGNHVVALHRDTIGGLTLPDDLAPGEHRILTEQDRIQIFAIS